ncbi:MAG: hypothetical protein WAQ28_00275 [Bacteroidia bacterium]
MKAGHYYSLFIICAMLFFSCRKEDSTHWDTRFLGPMVNASLDINNLLADSILQANPDSSLKIVYQNDVYRLSMDTLFKIPDTTLKQAYAIPLPVTLNPGQVVVNNNTSETTYNLPGVQLRTSIVKSGSVHYKIKSFINEKTKFVYSIPAAKLNGVAFSIDVVVPAAVGDEPGIYDAVYDLSGYVIDMTGINHNKVNTLYTSFTASVFDFGQPVMVNNQDSLIIENTFQDLIPYYAKGYFGQNTFNIGPSESNFDLFKRIVGGTVQLEDVDFNLRINNPIGLDARILIDNLSSVNTRTGTTINLSNSIIGSPININRASESGGFIYPYTVNFPLNPGNSNIKQMIENLPDKLGYSMQIIANPLGNISGSNDFIYSDHLLNATLDIEIPLSLVASDLTLADTLDLNISGNGAENVKSATFTLFADNGFPFDASLQLYMLNDMNVVSDSVFASYNTIDEAPVDSNLKVITKRLTKIAVPVSEAKMTHLLNTKRIIMKVKFNTASQPQYIKIYSNYTINVKLVGDINYSVHLN